MRRKPILALAVAGTIALTALAPRESSLPGAPDFVRQPAASPAKETPAVLPALPARPALERQAGRVFVSRTWEPPPPPTLRRSEPVPAPIPPMPYRLAGGVMLDGEWHPVLAKGNRVVPVRLGDLLEDGYRVDAIGPEAVTLVYVPLGLSQQLPMISALGSATLESGAAGGSAKP